ncbi:cytokine receptor-like factor 2 [Cynocephalus volans]|uniref:cytokine receptor-like factor 2 n=1 Tax=Cynocephalus volans TaxID=110931 RepID=UPI002FC599AF
MTWWEMLLASGEALQLQIVCFNFETVQVTWNESEYPGTNLTFLYKFSGDEVYDQCPNYTLQQGHNAGCLLEAKDQILYFSISNGTHPLLTRSQWVSDYLKPSSPKDVKLLWHQEAVTVTCSDLSYDGLLYEVQHRSTFDLEWQSKEERTCNVTIEGLDAEKCYCFRARVKATESSYGSDTQPSDWSEVTHWQSGELRDSCQENQEPSKPKFPKFILISSLVALLTVSLLFSCLWKLWRMKKRLIPRVPDPKFTFPGLFENHRGNFQEWIKDTQNVAHFSKTEGAERECGFEELLVVLPTKTRPSASQMVAPLCLQTGEEEASGGSLLLPRRSLQGGDVVSLGDFTFVVNDNAYMIL